VPGRPSSSFTFVQRLVLAIVPRAVWALLWLIGFTWRYEVIAEEGVTPLLLAKGGRGDLLFLASVRAALHVLLSPQPRRRF
jgi:hypothetical protein